MKTGQVFGVAVAVVGIIAVGATSAAAQTQAGEADLGSASFTLSGTTVSIPAVASCSVDGTESTSSGPVVRPGVTFGGGDASCTRAVVDPDSNTTSTTSTVKGKNVQLSALTNVGGPRISIAQYQLTCTGTQGHTAASWQFGGLSGLPALPSPVPPNYTQSISRADGTVLATAVYNLVSQPADGSTSLTMLTITFAPGSGISGSVTIGHTECTPTP